MRDELVPFPCWEETTDPEALLAALRAEGIPVAGYDSEGDSSGGQEFRFTYLVRPFEEPYDESVLDKLSDAVDRARRIHGI